MRRIRLFSVGCLWLGLTATLPAAPEYTWLDAKGEPLPFQTEAQILDFLKQAQVIERHRLVSGKTHPFKMLLERAGVRAHAIFREVRRQELRRTSRHGPKLVVRDDFIFEVAAYQLARILGLGNLPPVIARTLDGREGSLQMWLEETMTDQVRRGSRLEPPDPVRWDRQMQVIHIFDRLINNQDRTRPNLLIDRGWNLWMIDHTRAFEPGTDLFAPQRITGCENTLWERLRTTKPDTIRKRLDPYLSQQELEDLLVRWGRLVQHIEGLLSSDPEQEILFSLQE